MLQYGTSFLHANWEQEGRDCCGDAESREPAASVCANPMTRNKQK